MGVEICSRSATGHNFLFKLSIHSDMDHLGIPTSYFRQLTWTHSDKSLKPICHSEKPVSPSHALSVLLLPGAFQHLGRAGGRRRGLNSLWPPAGRLELPACCPGGAGLRMGEPALRFPLLWLGELCWHTLLSYNTGHTLFFPHAKRS